MRTENSRRPWRRVRKSFVIGMVILASILVVDPAFIRAQNRLRITPPVTVSVEVPRNNSVHWILPGPRILESAVFGTPQQPLGFEDAPEIGVMLENRLTNGDGSAYTTTSFMTPHSDNSAEISGSTSFTVTDITAVDGPATEDKIAFTAEFSGPNGNSYRVVVNKALPKGPVHPFFGGVVTNAYLHGGTGIGTKLQPRQFVFAGFWGVGKLYRNGEVVANNQLVHLMLSQRVRTSVEAGYRLVSSEEVDSLSGRQIHVILPPIMVTPDGPQQRPVPTGFVLPNGQQQPFIHIMFDQVDDIKGTIP